VLRAKGGAGSELGVDLFVFANESKFVAPARGGSYHEPNFVMPTNDLLDITKKWSVFLEAKHLHKEIIR